MKPLSQNTGEELGQHLKRLKTENIIDAFIVGFTVGIFAYSTFAAGLGFWSFFPLAIAYLIVKGSATKKILKQEIENELASRKID